ncbi:MAG TPA: ABC transporter substrate-binding protein [Oligoflexia bacterium]|nr:ABC transporter substrate-binding protein [Oligoflexia bacterium]HMP48101.1 ABC transporter substrate-binding protein [Oligoflexia bacterium]
MKSLPFPRRKITILFGILFLIFAFFYETGFFQKIGLKSDDDKQSKKVTSGNLNAPVHLIVVIPELEAVNFKKDIKRFQDSLQLGLKDYIGQGKVYIQTLMAPFPDQENVSHFFNTILSRSNGNILIAPFDGRHMGYLRQESHERGIPFLYFAHNENSRCINASISPFLWDLGVGPESYNELFLSYLGQRFGKLASDPGFYLYQNANAPEQERSRLLSELIEDLGFRQIGGVIVDEKLSDLYTTLRSVFQKKPDIFIASTTPPGRARFLPQAAKLGFNLEMGLAFEYGTEEEELRSNENAAEGFIVPVTYVHDIPGEKNKKFIIDLVSYDSSYTSENPPTMANYRGYLIATLISLTLENKILSNFSEKISEQGKFSENFISSLRDLDSKIIEGPSGQFQVFEKIQGLIQPFHISEYKSGLLNHQKYLGDLSLPSSFKCQNSAE